MRAEGKRIVQCHGTFDLIHPGHIYHLEEAKELGDVLIVTVTAEQFVNKGPGRPYFNDTLRCKSLAALACVDYVVLVPYPAAKEAIECVRPHIYCKGREYEDPENDPTGKIQEDVATVQAIGGQVRYIGSVVFSSSKLINRHFDAVPEGVKLFCQKLAKTCSPEQFRREVEGFADLRVLVLGDVIFDRYTYVTVQGLTSKNRILSTRMLDEETHAGGALAVYRHVKEFTAHVDFCAIVGNDAWTRETMAAIVPKENDLCLYEEDFTTIIKQRFIEDGGSGKELLKLFSVNMIDAEHPGKEVAERLLKVLEKNIKKYDAVLVADFGHGTMLEPIRRFVEAKAAFMSLNCQTNSNNYGFNIINRQYRRTDAFSLDEKELILAYGRKNLRHPEDLLNLKIHFGAETAWCTRGADESIGIKTGEEPVFLMAMETRVVDTVGAGDAFYAVASLSACRGHSAELSTFFGQLAGAHAVRIVGNREPISKSRILKSGMTLLNL